MWMKEFRSWVEQARIGELFAKRDALYEMRRLLKSPEVKADARRMIREIDQELLARAEACAFEKRELKAV